MASAEVPPAPAEPVPIRQQQDPNAVSQYIDNVKAAPEAPYIFLDMIVKSSAPLYYFFCLHFTKNFIINFVVTTVLIVVEFWYTKNIVGRRLTGMRWWQVPSPDSTKTTWRFEHRTLEQADYKPSRPAVLQFWGGMFGLVVYWIVMVIFEFSKPTYLILALMALFFVLMNLLGYYRCRSWSTQELRLQQAGAGAFGGMVSGFTQGVASNFMSVINRV